MLEVVSKFRVSTVCWRTLTANTQIKLQSGIILLLKWNEMWQLTLCTFYITSSVSHCVRHDECVKYREILVPIEICVNPRERISSWKYSGHLGLNLGRRATNCKEHNVFSLTLIPKSLKYSENFGSSIMNVNHKGTTHTLTTFPRELSGKGNARCPHTHTYRTQDMLY